MNLHRLLDLLHPLNSNLLRILRTYQQDVSSPCLKDKIHCSSQLHHIEPKNDTWIASDDILLRHWWVAMHGSGSYYDTGGWQRMAVAAIVMTMHGCVDGVLVTVHACDGD